MVEPHGRAEAAGRRAGKDATPEVELSRLRSEAAFHQQLRDLTIAFSRGVSSTLGLSTALQTLAFDANALLGARRTTVWLHERRIRELVLAASSDPAHAAAAD